MLLTLQRYRLTIKYKKGTSLHLADTLLRAALPTLVHTRATGFKVFRTERTERLPVETKKDEHLNRSRPAEWQKPGTATTTSILRYRNDLKTDNGLIYKGVQVMISQPMQAEMLLKIHTRHFGPE